MWIGYSKRGCRLCGSPAVHRHRIIPGAYGGEYERGNVIRLCPTCHAGAHVLTDWCVAQINGSWRPWGRSGSHRVRLVRYFLGRKRLRAFFLKVIKPRITAALQKA